MRRGPLPSPWNRHPLLILSRRVRRHHRGASPRRARLDWRRHGQSRPCRSPLHTPCPRRRLASPPSFTSWRREDQGPDGCYPVVPRFMARNGGSSDKSGAAMATDFLAGGGNGIGVTAPAKVQTHDPLVPSARLGAVRGRTRVRPQPPHAPRGRRACSPVRAIPLDQGAHEAACHRGACASPPRDW